MTTTHPMPAHVPAEAQAQTPTRAELVSTITDFCLDLIHRCDGHAFTKGSPPLEALAIYAYGAVHTIADRHRLNLTNRHMLAVKLYVEFFGMASTLALANACALAGAAFYADSPRYAVIQSSAAAFRDWQRDSALLDTDDFRAHLPWPDIA